MTDRDHFAAAALTGLLSKSIAPEQAMREYVRIASAYAEAMLREREKTIVCDTKKPVAWIAFATDGSESSAVYLMREQAQAAADEWGWDVAPLYARPMLTDAEQKAIAVAIVGSLPSSAATLRNLLERMT